MDSIYSADGKIVEYDSGGFVIPPSNLVVWSFRPNFHPGESPFDVHLVLDTGECLSVSSVSPTLIPYNLYGFCFPPYKQGNYVVLYLPAFYGNNYGLFTRALRLMMLGDVLSYADQYDLLHEVITYNSTVVSIRQGHANLPFWEVLDFIFKFNEIAVEGMLVDMPASVYGPLLYQLQRGFRVFSLKYVNANLTQNTWYVYTLPHYRFPGGLDYYFSVPHVWYGTLAQQQVEAYYFLAGCEIFFPGDIICYRYAGRYLAIPLVPDLFSQLTGGVVSFFLNPTAQWTDFVTASPAIMGPSVGYGAPYFIVTGDSVKVVTSDDCDGAPVCSTRYFFYWMYFTLHHGVYIVPWSNWHLYSGKLFYQVFTLFTEEHIHFDGFVIAKIHYRDVKCSGCVPCRPAPLWSGDSPEDNLYCTTTAQGGDCIVGLVNVNASSDTELLPDVRRLARRYKSNIDSVMSAFNPTSGDVIRIGTHLESVERGTVRVAAVDRGLYEQGTVRPVGVVDTIEDGLPLCVSISTPLWELAYCTALDKLVRDAENSSVSSVRVESTFGDKAMLWIESRNTLHFSVSVLRELDEELVLHSCNMCRIGYLPRCVYAFTPFISGVNRYLLPEKLMRKRAQYLQSICIYSCEVSWGVKIAVPVTDSQFDLQYPAFLAVRCLSKKTYVIKDYYAHPDPETLQRVTTVSFTGPICLGKSYRSFLEKSKTLLFHTSDEIISVQVEQNDENDPPVGTIVHRAQVPSPPAPLYAVSSVKALADLYLVS